MSVFSDKRVFGIKRQNCGGVSTAGQVCANDVILWVIFLLPINIVIHGAGQCLVAMGLFVGNVVGWIFLSKRMNSYAEISPKKIHNAPELFAARYGSWKLKDLVSVIWIVTLGLILVSVLKVIVSVVAYFMDMPESISLAIIVSFLILATILVDNKLMGIIKTIVFIMVIIVCLTMIGLVFYRMDAREILDNYRRSRLAGGTSIYLNILYYDGKTVDIGSAISMTGVGLGCIAMPLMYKGVLNIRDNKELDVGRIWAVIFEGFTILSSCILALLVVPVLYPEKAWANMNSFQVYNLMLKKLLGKRPQFFRGIWVKSNIGGEKGTQFVYRKLADRRSCHGKRVDKALVGPVADLHFRDLLGSAHALLQQIFHVAALSQATTPPAPDCGRTPQRGSSAHSPGYSYRRQGIPPP